MKKCRTCGQVKPESEFYVNKDRGVIRLKNECKECMRQKQRQYIHEKRNNIWIPEKEKTAKESQVDMVTKFLDACDYNKSNIDQLPEEKFRRLFRIEEELDYCSLKQEAKERLTDLGYNNPSTKNFTADGNYLIFGDTFGKKTSTAKFKVLQNIADLLIDPTVIVIGHNTDDYNDVSYELNNFNAPLYFLPIANELKDVNNFCKQATDCHIVLDSIKVGDILIKNQEHITPYVKTAISSLDPLLYKGKCIVNCTRHEYFQRTSTYEKQYICSPGAMAEPHVVRVAYKLTLTNGGRINVKPVGRDSFLKYRKNNVDKELWECGCIIVHVRNGQTDLELVRFNTDDSISCVLRDGTFIDSESGIDEIRPELAVLSDLHAPDYDSWDYETLYGQLAQLEPEKIVINGDLMDCRAMNPHNKHQAAKADFADDLHITSSLLQDLSKIAPIDIIWGNHETFIQRFAEQFPQLVRFFMESVENVLDKYADLVNTNKNDVVPYCQRKLFITHGANDLYGVAGKQIEKIAKSIDRHTLMGHTHSPAIRFGVYCAGCLCNDDQEYNNATTLNWEHGYLLVYHRFGKVYVHQVFIGSN